MMDLILLRLYEVLPSQLQFVASLFQHKHDRDKTYDSCSSARKDLTLYEKSPSRWTWVLEQVLEGTFSNLAYILRLRTKPSHHPQPQGEILLSSLLHSRDLCPKGSQSSCRMFWNKCHAALLSSDIQRWTLDLDKENQLYDHQITFKLVRIYLYVGI